MSSFTLLDLDNGVVATLSESLAFDGTSAKSTRDGSTAPEVIPHQWYGAGAGVEGPDAPCSAIGLPADILLPPNRCSAEVYLAGNLDVWEVPLSETRHAATNAALYFSAAEPVSDDRDAGSSAVPKGSKRHVIYMLLVARRDTCGASDASTSLSTAAPAVWTIFRRYRDFRALADCLKKRGSLVSAPPSIASSLLSAGFPSVSSSSPAPATPPVLAPAPSLPSFPGKHWGFGAPDADFLARRRTGLAAWLSAVLAFLTASPVLPPELVSFLSDGADCTPPGLDLGQYASLVATVEARAAAVAGLEAGGAAVAAAGAAGPSPPGESPHGYQALPIPAAILSSAASATAGREQHARGHPLPALTPPPPVLCNAPQPRDTRPLPPIELPAASLHPAPGSLLAMSKMSGAPEQVGNRGDAGSVGATAPDAAAVVEKKHSGLFGRFSGSGTNLSGMLGFSDKKGSGGSKGNLKGSHSASGTNLSALLSSASLHAAGGDGESSAASAISAASPLPTPAPGGTFARGIPHAPSPVPSVAGAAHWHMHQLVGPLTPAPPLVNVDEFEGASGSYGAPATTLTVSTSAATSRVLPQPSPLLATAGAKGVNAVVPGRPAVGVLLPALQVAISGASRGPMAMSGASRGAMVVDTAAPSPAAAPAAAPSKSDANAASVSQAPALSPTAPSTPPPPSPAAVAVTAAAAAPASSAALLAHFHRRSVAHAAASIVSGSARLQQRQALVAAPQPPPACSQPIAVASKNAAKALRDRASASAAAASTTEGPGTLRPCIGLADFDLLSVLGTGSFGKVLLVRLKPGSRARTETRNTLYAMKVLQKANIIERNQVAHTLTERRVLSYSRHPFLVGLQFAFQTADKLFLVLDFAAGGELFFHLSRQGPFSEGTARFYAAELVLALGHLHSRGVIYRDLKPENVLLGADGHVKLADFGLSKENVAGVDFGASSFCGTPEYLSPEVLNRTGHGFSVDWWGLGMVLFEMLTGLPPWYTRNRAELYARIRSSPLEVPLLTSEGTPFSPQARDILHGLLDRDPSRRLGAVGDAGAIAAHSWFAGMDWEALAAKRVPPPFIPEFRDAGGAGPVGETALPEVRYFEREFTDQPVNIRLDCEPEQEAPQAAVGRGGTATAATHTGGGGAFAAGRPPPRALPSVAGRGAFSLTGLAVASGSSPSPNVQLPCGGSEHGEAAAATAAANAPHTPPSQSPPPWGGDPGSGRRTAPSMFSNFTFEAPSQLRSESGASSSLAQHFSFLLQQSHSGSGSGRNLSIVSSSFNEAGTRDGGIRHGSSDRALQLQQQQLFHDAGQLAPASVSQRSTTLHPAAPSTDSDDIPSPSSSQSALLLDAAAGALLPLASGSDASYPLGSLPRGYTGSAGGDFSQPFLLQRAGSTGDSGDGMMVLEQLQFRRDSVPLFAAAASLASAQTASFCGTPGGAASSGAGRPLFAPGAGTEGGSPRAHRWEAASPPTAPAAQPTLSVLRSVPAPTRIQQDSGRSISMEIAAGVAAAAAASRAAFGPQAGW